MSDRKERGDLAHGASRDRTSPVSAQAFTRFLFIVAREHDDAFLARLRSAGSVVARGFFNDYDADGTRDQQPQETVQFLIADGSAYPDSIIAAAGHVVQVTAKYRPRLQAVEHELRRRLGDLAEILSIEGCERPSHYSSPEMREFATRRAPVRRPARQSGHALILPLSKTDAWWAMPPLARQTYFYPHVDRDSGCEVPGHATAAEEGITTLFRRLYHNPDGYQRPGEYDFIACFECEERHLEAFARVHEALRDTTRNPEWRFVREGPLWKGRRVLKW
jgi:chlorite dismutase